MNVSIEDAGPCRKVMHIDVGAEDVASDYDKILKAYAREARIPGFRKSKAPAHLVEARFRKNIEEDARQELIPRCYREALDNQKVEPVAIVGVENVVFSKESGLQFDVTLDVAPEFKLPKYKKITVKAEKVEVTDAQVDEQVDGLRKRLSTYEDVTDRPLEEGDLANIDYSGVSDGVPVKDLAEEASGLGEGTDFLVMMGEPEYLPGIKDGLVGASIGDTRTLEVNFPETYHVAPLAGKSATYDIEIKSIRGSCLPEIDEEFLKKLDVESEDTLRSRIRTELDSDAAQREKGHLRNEIGKFLLEKTNFELPQSVVEQETSLMAREMVRQITMRGATPEQVEGQREAILAESVRTSQDRVKLGYILTRIADEADVHIDDAAVDTRVGALATQYQMSPEQFRAELDKRNGVESVRSELRSDKTIDFLIENAKIK